MLDIFEKWYKRYLFEEESILLLVLLIISVALLMTIGDILAPVIASLILAYLMQGVANVLERLGLPTVEPRGAFYAFPHVAGCYRDGRRGSLELAEWLPLALLEAMAARRAVVATDVGEVGTVLGRDGTRNQPGAAGGAGQTGAGTRRASSRWPTPTPSTTPMIQLAAARWARPNQ